MKATELEQTRMIRWENESIGIEVAWSERRGEPDLVLQINGVVVHSGPAPDLVALRDVLDQAVKMAKGKPANAGRRWEAAEEQLLAAAFGEGISETQIAKQLGRTKGSVRSRLVHLGLIEDDTRWPTQARAARL